MCALATTLKQRQDFLEQVKVKVKVKVKKRQDGLGQRSRPEEAAGEAKAGEGEGGQAGEGGEGDEVIFGSSSILELVFVFVCKGTKSIHLRVLGEGENEAAVPELWGETSRSVTFH